MESYTANNKQNYTTKNAKNHLKNQCRPIVYVITDIVLMLKSAKIVYSC